MVSSSSRRRRRSRSRSRSRSSSSSSSSSSSIEITILAAAYNYKGVAKELHLLSPFMLAFPQGITLIGPFVVRSLPVCWMEAIRRYKQVFLTKGNRHNR